MKILFRGLFVLLIVVLPFIVILGGSNLAMRMPDVYVYQLNDSQITEEIDLDVDNEELAEVFSDFMFGKSDDFKLNANYRGREQEVFSQGENIAMHNYKGFIDRTVIPLIIFTILGIISYTMLFLQEKDIALRVAFKIGASLYAFFMVIISILYLIPVTKSYFFNLIFHYTFGSDDIIPVILTSSFASQMILGITFVSGVALALIGYATWQITKTKRMFQ